MGSKGGIAPATMAQGPPYPPAIWSLGGAPQKRVDIPITSVFLVLFIIGAATHMTIFQLNKRRGHKFLFNIFIFAFCMARIVTCILRIASTSLPHDAQLAIAAQIFVAAGVLIIFVINLLWAQRIVRSLHPSIGWHRLSSITIRILYALIGFTLVIVITATVQSLYTLRTRTRTIDRALQLYGVTLLATVSTLPIPIVLLALVVPRHRPHDRFGTGRLRTKIAVLLTGSMLLCLGAWFRCGTAWQKPVPRSRPLPGYYSKACFYVFNFLVEILTVYLYAVMRVDLRFHIPDGAKGPGSYTVSRQGVATKGSTKDVEKQTQKDAENTDEAEDINRKDSVLDGQRRLNSLTGRKERQQVMKTLNESNESLTQSRKSLYAKEEEAAIIKRLGGPSDKKEDGESVQ
ncbi:hypothetical protein B0J11DRAFT_584119 [Dendryphion nanum]|uniref:Uncharacterized protein n=1 Tax=Dendryphion nanum TaxID=256645 RepID=A0A9P9IDP2_9PLEO|nr:hypothetical protein B0J11DRAFT_584119 [Dendryphion nanum]